MGTLVLCLNFALFLIPGVLSGGYGGYRGGLGYLNNRLKEDARRNWLNDLKNSMRDRRYWDKDEEAWNLLDRIERESTTKALEDLEDLLGELDHRYRGLSQDILRRLIKKYNLTEPMVYTAYTNQLSSSSAEKYCLSKGKRIAVIRNALEHSLARQAALALSLRKVYIGFHYSASRKFYWSDGTKVTYHRVDRLRASHGCYVMKVNSADWISTACSNKFPFLCETTPKKTQSGQAFPTTALPRKTTPKVPQRTDGHPTRKVPPRRRPTPAQDNVKKQRTTSRPVAEVPPRRRPTPAQDNVKKQRTTSRPVAGHSASASRSTTKRQVSVEMTMDVDYQTAMTSPTFQTDMIKVVAGVLTIPESRVRITGLRSGSTIVSFAIEMADSDTRTENGLRETLEMAAARGQLTVMVDGKPIYPKKNAPIFCGGDPQPTRIRVILLVVFIFVGITIIAIIVGLIKWRQIRQRRRSPSTAGPKVIHTVTDSRCQVYAEAHDEKKVPFEDLPEYTGPPPEADAPPKYRDCVA